MMSVYNNHDVFVASDDDDDDDVMLMMEMVIWFITIT